MQLCLVFLLFPNQQLEAVLALCRNSSLYKLVVSRAWFARDRRLDGSEVSLRTALAYSLSVGGVAFALSALGPLQDIYARYYGLEFPQMAIASGVASFVSAIANPIVGVLADRYCPGRVSRKCWVLVAFTLLILTEHPLLCPPSQVSTTYLTCWLTLAILCWVLFDAPHLAWGERLAPSYDSRTRTFAVRSLTCSVGSLVFYALPLLPIFRTTDLTPETLRGHRCCPMCFGCQSCVSR